MDTYIELESSVCIILALSWDNPSSSNASLPGSAGFISPIYFIYLSNGTFCSFSQYLSEPTLERGVVYKPWSITFRLYVCISSFVYGRICAMLVFGGRLVLMEGWRVRGFVQLLESCGETDDNAVCHFCALPVVDRLLGLVLKHACWLTCRLGGFV